MASSYCSGHSDELEGVLTEVKELEKEFKRRLKFAGKQPVDPDGSLPQLRNRSVMPLPRALPLFTVLLRSAFLLL